MLSYQVPMSTVQESVEAKILCPKCGSENFPNIDPDGQSVFCGRCHIRFYREHSPLVVEGRVIHTITLKKKRKKSEYKEKMKLHNEDKIRVGKLLQELRTKKEITVRQAAQAVGVSYTSMLSYEKGIDAPWRLEKRQRIADYYGVPLKSLWRYEVPDGR